MTATQVVFNKDSGGNYDPANTSTISLSAFGGTITSVTYSDNQDYITRSNPSTSGVTATFSANRTKAQVEQANTVTAAVTGTTSDGTTGVNFGSITVDIPTVINGADGGDGTNGLRSVQGYLYYEKTTSGAPNTTNLSTTYYFSMEVYLVQELVQELTLGQTHLEHKILQVVMFSGSVRYYGIESSGKF